MGRIPDTVLVSLIEREAFGTINEVLPQGRTLPALMKASTSPEGVPEITTRITMRDLLRPVESLVEFGIPPTLVERFGFSFTSNILGGEGSYVVELRCGSGEKVIESLSRTGFVAEQPTGECPVFSKEIKGSKYSVLLEKNYAVLGPTDEVKRAARIRTGPVTSVAQMPGVGQVLAHAHRSKMVFLVGPVDRESHTVATFVDEIKPDGKAFFRTAICFPDSKSGERLAKSIRDRFAALPRTENGATFTRLETAGRVMIVSGEGPLLKVLGD